MMQLVSDDVNLYQFALAMLAYSLDSPAWYKCGDPGENYTESECLLTYPDVQRQHLAINRVHRNVNGLALLAQRMAWFVELI